MSKNRQLPPDMQAEFYFSTSCTDFNIRLCDVTRSMRFWCSRPEVAHRACVKAKAEHFELELSKYLRL